MKLPPRHAHSLKAPLAASIILFASVASISASDRWHRRRGLFQSWAIHAFLSHVAGGAMSMKMRSLLLAMSFAMTGCSDGLKSPSDAFLIPEEKMAAVVKDADHGDLGAIKRLIAHYEASSGNDAVAEEWRTKARALGDAQEHYYYAARTFTGARSEPDLVKKRDMLADALEAARRSYVSRADASTQQLIDKITQAIDATQ